MPKLFFQLVSLLLVPLLAANPLLAELTVCADPTFALSHRSISSADPFKTQAMSPVARWFRSLTFLSAKGRHGVLSESRMTLERLRSRSAELRDALVWPLSIYLSRQDL